MLRPKATGLARRGRNPTSTSVSTIAGNKHKGNMELDDLKSKYPGAASFRFGDCASLSALLIKLVRKGKKTATCGALHDFTDDGDELPIAGRCDIVLNWDGTPALVIKTVAVETSRFCDVNEEFALQEGENDSLEDWRSSHRAFFERNGGFDDTMLLVCERFEMVEDLGYRNDESHVGSR